MEFNIPEGDASVTLRVWSIQANQQVLFDFNIAKEKLTHSVIGVYEPRDALRLLLADTGLHAEQINEVTWGVIPIPRTSEHYNYCLPSQCPKLWNCIPERYTQTFKDLLFVQVTEREMCLVLPYNDQ